MKNEIKITIIENGKLGNYQCKGTVNDLLYVPEYLRDDEYDDNIYLVDNYWDDDYEVNVEFVDNY